jgi:hypothetical protein
MDTNKLGTVQSAQELRCSSGALHAIYEVSFECPPITQGSMFYVGECMLTQQSNPIRITGSQVESSEADRQIPIELCRRRRGERESSRRHR